MSSTTSRYSDEIKKQFVSLVNSGESISEVDNEYNVAKSTVHKWTMDYNNSNSIKAKITLQTLRKNL